LRLHLIEAYGFESEPTNLKINLLQMKWESSF